MIPINFYNLVRIIYFKFIENYRLKFTWIHNHMIIFKSSYCYHISLSDSSILIRFCIVLAKLERVLSSAKLWAEVEKVIAKDFKWNRTYKWSRRNFSLVAHYSLKFTRYLLLVVKVVTRCKITRCRSCSLQKITRYSLQNSLVTRCRSYWLQINPTHLHSITKYCKRLLNVFAGETVWHCIVSFLTLPSASWLKRTC